MLEISRASLSLFWVLIAAASIFPQCAQSDWNEQILHSFGATGDGFQVNAGLSRDAFGNLYGTTVQGGPDNRGIIYELAPDGTETILHHFGGDEGYFPFGGVVLDNSGNLYGTTTSGGPRGYDSGAVFKLAPDGVFTILHVFGQGQDGANPMAGLLRAKNGVLYGTTKYSTGIYSQGDIFRIEKNGSESLIGGFPNGGDYGAWPVAPLVIDDSGNLYGTASYDHDGPDGYGTVFKVASNGSSEEVVHQFHGGDGATPVAGLFRDKTGTFYGTTSRGGRHGIGVVFKIDATGAFSVLYNFVGRRRHGAYPCASLIMDRKGNLYGTTEAGGANDLGTVFRITAAGKEGVIYSFGAFQGDGKYPVAELIADREGNFFGTTQAGGAYGGGTVFKLTRPPAQH